jgi:hypothetical protein
MSPSGSVYESSSRPCKETWQLISVRIHPKDEDLVLAFSCTYTLCKGSVD